MKANKIALKFCGGCNPNYDRLELLNRLKKTLEPDLEWVAYTDQNADKVLIICGCATQCAEVRQIPQQKRIWISDENHLEDLIASLKKA